MTLHDAMERMKEWHQQIRVRLPDWEKMDFLFIVNDTFYKMHDDTPSVYRLTVHDVQRDDWEAHIPVMIDHTPDEDNMDDCYISVSIEKSEDEWYTGTIHIKTPAYLRPRYALERLIRLSRDYDLGFDVEDLDFEALMIACGR